MTITKTDGKYGLEFQFSWDFVRICQDIKAEVGVKSFHFATGKWWFTDLALIQRLRTAFPDVAVAPEVESDLQGHSAWAEGEKARIETAMRLRDALTTDFVVKNVKRPLYPFQSVICEFIINNKGRAYLDLEMGCGKTAISLAYVAHAEIQKTVVVCPASIKSVWENETGKVTSLKPYVVDAKTPLTLESWNAHDVIILNYEALKKYFDFLKAVRIGCLIADEATRLKSSKAMRTKLFGALSREVPSVIFLSGSPVLNRPEELFAPLNMLNPKEWGDFWAFARRYCAAVKNRFGWDTSGSSNIEELRNRIAPYFIKRLKSEVLKDLPERIYSEIFIDLDPDARKKYDAAEADFVNGLSAGGEGAALVHLNNLRQIASQGKIEAVTDFLADMVESEKAICFSNYVDPLKQIADYFGDKSVTITGQTKQEDRGGIVKSFQEDPNVRLFLGGMRSAGEGLTLTEAKSTIFLDYSFVPADHQQAAARNHRPGVKHQSLNVYQFIARGTIDARMRAVLSSKKDVIDKLLSNEPSKNESFMVGELVASYRKKKHEDLQPV